jgi:integrase
VAIDNELLALFRGWHAKTTGSFVIEADAEPRTDMNYTFYRAQTHFDVLIKWLKSKGVSAVKPLHELRKEFGSQVCTKGGIYAASKMLRHADIGITAQHYVDQKERVTFGMGNLLVLPSNVTQMPQGDRKTGTRAATVRSARK